MSSESYHIDRQTNREKLGTKNRQNSSKFSGKKKHRGYVYMSSSFTQTILNSTGFTISE